MARCTTCFSIVTKTDLDCYVCGEPLPGAPGPFRRALTRFFSKPKPSSKKVKMAAATGSGNQNLPEISR
jgi:hypothetical protein